MHHSIYNFPDVYDAVLRASGEQAEAECATVERLLERHGVHGKARILELACGNSVHGIKLAQNGHAVTGIDKAQEMLDNAALSAKQKGITVELINANIIDFDLPQKQFDCAIFMAETYPLITNENDIHKHLSSVHDHLRDGGIYIIDLDMQTGIIRDKHEIWGERTITVNGKKVEIYIEDFPGDTEKKINHLTLHCRIHIDNKVIETTDDWYVVSKTPSDYKEFFTNLKHFHFEGFNNWQNLSENITDCEHFFAVLKKI